MSNFIKQCLQFRGQTYHYGLFIYINHRCSSLPKYVPLYCICPYSKRQDYVLRDIMSFVVERIIRIKGSVIDLTVANKLSSYPHTFVMVEDCCKSCVLFRKNAVVSPLLSQGFDYSSKERGHDGRTRIC